MLQRIQTLFLSIALLVMGLFLWLPIGEIVAGEKIYTFTINGIIEGQNSTAVISAGYLLPLLLAILILQVAIIFLYKKRILQIRMTTFNLLLMIVFVIVGWLFINTSSSSLGNGAYSLKMTFVLPLVSAVLNVLAIRSIRKDEELVRSVDRIR